MPERDPYEILGAAHGADASEIHRCYLEKLRQVHPDHAAGDGEGAHERTVEVVAAYRLLSDPEARGRHDLRVANPPLAEGSLPGFGPLKGRRKRAAEARFAEGARRLVRGDALAAVDPLKAALRLEPDFPEAAYDLALAGALLGNGAFALDVLADALKRRPQDARMLRLRKSVHAAFLTV